MTGYSRDADVDEFERKEQLRKARRRPVEETVAELGEGRGRDWTHSISSLDRANQLSLGIYGPGYQERRRARLEKKYGIKIPQHPSPEL